jgi:hypothetical protein
MTFRKLTTILIVDSIEGCLPAWEKLGYRVTDQVPEQAPLAFAILSGAAGELMLQTRASLKDDLPEVSALTPSFLLYGSVASLAAARETAQGARVLVPERRTFYGALESWLQLPEGTVVCLAEHSGS